MKFLKGFLVFILLTIIIGGVGYIGYTSLFKGGMNMSGNTATATPTQMPAMGADKNKNPDQQNMQGNNQLALSQSNVVLQNKERLEKSIAAINESSRLMSVDPYAPSSDNKSGMSNMQPQQSMAPVQPSQGDVPAITNTGNNSTIYVFPQGNSQNAPANTTQPNSGMQNMGTTYDASKMEQLHAGLYKIAVGKALLDQLQSELVYQVEFATTNLQNPIQYYSNQYNLTVQNKSKLSQALTYVNEAVNFVNVNPYVSVNGLVYDKDRMNQLHQSILKLAEGVVSLNQLGDDFNRQSIFLSNAVQNYTIAANSMTSMNTSTSLFGGLFDNISMSSIINIILIIFAIGLIAGIFGFIASLLKPPSPKAVNKDSDLTKN